jgi:hypothetical protein
LWSVVPFIVGVGVVTAWLHRRLGALSGILFLFLATASPLLLDISRMARGDGLAFLGMSVVVVGALEAEKTKSWWPIVALTAGGLIGSLTLPHFTVAYVTVAATLLTRTELRARVAVATVPALFCVAAWYAPHAGQIASTSLSDYGIPISTRWLLIAPLDQIAVPALTQLDDAFVRTTLGSIVLVVLLAAAITSSPLMRQRRSAVVLVAPVATTVLAFWLNGTHVVPRFFSFLLVPIFMLVATGAATTLSRLGRRPQPGRTLIVAALFGILVFQFVGLVVDVSRMPRDATAEAAILIRRTVSSATPVLAHVPYPFDLVHFLDRPVTSAWTGADAGRACHFNREVVYVDQPYLVPRGVLRCLGRDGVRHYRLELYARGGRIDLWVIPPVATGPHTNVSGGP